MTDETEEATALEELRALLFPKPDKTDVDRTDISALFQTKPTEEN